MTKPNFWYVKSFLVTKWACRRDNRTRVPSVMGSLAIFGAITSLLQPYSILHLEGFWRRQYPKWPHVIDEYPTKGDTPISEWWWMKTFWYDNINIVHEATIQVLWFMKQNTNSQKMWSCCFLLLKSIVVLSKLIKQNKEKYVLTPKDHHQVVTSHFLCPQKWVANQSLYPQAALRAWIALQPRDGAHHNCWSVWHPVNGRPIQSCKPKGNPK